MGEHYMRLGDAERYLAETYNLKWSRPYWVKLIRTGKLRGQQLAGEKGWWYVTKESVDELFASFPPRRGI